MGLKGERERMVHVFLLALDERRGSFGRIGTPGWKPPLGLICGMSAKNRLWWFFPSFFFFFLSAIFTLSFLGPKPRNDEAHRENNPNEKREQNSFRAQSIKTTSTKDKKERARTGKKMNGCDFGSRVPPSVDKVADRVSISFGLQIPVPSIESCAMAMHTGPHAHTCIQAAPTTVSLSCFYFLFLIYLLSFPWPFVLLHTQSERESLLIRSFNPSLVLVQLYLHPCVNV